MKNIWSTTTFIIILYIVLKENVKPTTLLQLADKY